jgi:hypothetical protein
MNNIFLIVNDLLDAKGFYILPATNAHGRASYKMYSDNMNPQYYIKPRTFGTIRNLMKRDSRGRLTLNLSLVRQLHGNSWIKKAYKNHAKNQKLSAVSRIENQNSKAAGAQG